VLFLYCLLTVIIETPLMALFGWHSRKEIMTIAVVNAISNLCLNLILTFCIKDPGLWILAMEAAVVLFEYLAYSRAFGRSARLFFATFSANCISFGLGALVFS